MYISGLSSLAISKRVSGASLATIKRWVSDEGIQRSVSEARGGTKEKRAAAADLYKTGLGAFEIARKLGVTNHAIYGWLSDAGVEIRSKSEAQAFRAAQGRQPIRGVRSTIETKWGSILTDSLFEAARLRQLEADDSVADVRRATESIPWGDGQRYTPDLVVASKDGTVRVEEIKPAFQMERADVLAKAEAARLALGKDISYRLVSTDDLASGFALLDPSKGIRFASDEDADRFKRALATAKSATKSAIGNRGTFDPHNPSILAEDRAPFGEPR
jgi:transposase